MASCRSAKYKLEASLILANSRFDCRFSSFVEYEDFCDRSFNKNIDVLPEYSRLELCFSGKPRFFGCSQKRYSLKTIAEFENGNYWIYNFFIGLPLHLSHYTQPFEKIIS